MPDSNILGSALLPLQALLRHLFQEGSYRGDVEQRAFMQLLQTTIHDTLEAEVVETSIILKTIFDIISLSLSQLTLPEKLQKALERILSVPSVNGIDKGCLFQVDNETGQLHLIAQHNFSDELISLCKTIRFGQCLCGQAMASDQSIYFKSTLDDDHEIRPSDIQPHGHTIFKVKSLDSDHVIMLVNLYIADKSKDDPRKKLFTDSIAMSLAVLHTLHTTNERMNNFVFEDPLTRIPNRRLFIDRLEQSTLKARRIGDSFAVIVLGIDRFSRINDSMGRQAGDEVLKILATRLSDILRAGDTVAKADGDEFLLLFAIQNTREIMPPVRRIQNTVAKPIQVHDREIQINLSIGISLFPDDQNQLLEKAKFALKISKEKGGGIFQIYSNEAHLKTQNLLNMEQDLRTAINNQWLVTYYQPKISLSTMTIIGFEALVRWPDPVHPDKMKFFPDQFIPLAEETGLILPLGQYVLATACKDLKSWLDQGYENLHMAVNLSARQFSDPNLLNDITTSLQKSGLPPANLELEITESYVMVDAIKAKETLAALKKLGVKISLDDFGTGYSSFSHLKNFPFDRLKIDRSFVIDLFSRQADVDIVRAILQMARSLHLQVTAEGVETEEQQNQLLQAGCDDVQGWLHSKAVPAAEIPALLKKYNNTPRTLP